MVEGLAAWGLRWLQRKTPARNLDVALLMWDIRRAIYAATWFRRPPPRHRVPLRAACPAQADLVADFEEGDVDLCIKKPGFDVDLRVQTDVRTLTDIWMGVQGRSTQARCSSRRGHSRASSASATRSALVRMPQWRWPR